MPQKKQYGLSDLRVGLLVLGAIGILILALFAATGDVSLPGFGKKTTVKTYMGNVDGLRKGGEVRLSGVRIGSIRDINFSPQIPQSSDAPNLVEIIMEISGRLDGRPAIERIRSDSRAVLKSAGVLGDYVVDITPGTVNGKPIQNGDTIQSIQQKGVGDIINAAQTAVANFNDISEDIKALTQEIRAGRGNIGRLIKEDTLYTNLNRSVLQAEELIASLRKGDGTAAKFINDPELYNQANETVAQLKKTIADINEQLNAGRGTIGKLYKDEELYNRANQLVAKVNEASARLDSLMAKVERGEGNLGKLFNDEKLYEDTRASLASIRTLAASLERGEGTAGKLLKDETLYTNINNASAEITKLLYDFRQNPKKYLSIKVSVF
jgi:phospholipid/cholesterol/gamma-HCH transport system substrate-binding protein